MTSSDENFQRKNDRTFHQRILSRARDEPAETPLAPATLTTAMQNTLTWMPFIHSRTPEVKSSGEFTCWYPVLLVVMILIENNL